MEVTRMRWFDPVDDFGTRNPVEWLRAGDLSTLRDPLPPDAVARIRWTAHHSETLLDVLRTLETLTPRAIPR
jgi:hypothetical protein